MSFQEGQKYYQQLKAQLDAGQITREQFAGQLSRVRFQDESGAWWCLSPQDGSWLRWDGRSWSPAPPPPPAQTAAPPPPPGICSKCQAALKPGKKFCGVCGAPVGTVPPGPAAPPTEIPATELVIPVAPEQRRRGSDSAGRWGRATWNIFSIAGCSVISGLWLWYSGMAETKPDYKTCITIVALPLATMLLRGQIDRLLRPLQKVFGGIPKMVRLGIGLAIPFLMANYLYAAGYSQFDYMFRTVIFSTLLSYLLLRVPSPVRRVAAHARRVV